MKFQLLVCTLAFVALLFVHGPAAQAQGDVPYGPTTPTDLTQKSFAQQKAEARAKQRMARLEVNRRYGFSPNRPPSVAIPFTASHTLPWMRTGRNPLVRYQPTQPTYYYAYPYTVYR